MRDDYDFNDAKRAGELPALTRLHAENGTKERITIRLDADIVAWFRESVAGGGNYQSLINQALREHIETAEGTLARRLRKIIREELRRAS